MNKEFQTSLLLPPTDQELEMLGLVSGILFILTVIMITLVVSYSGYLVFKTKLPGRFEVFIGSCMFAIFYVWSLYMGGYLEMTLGPLGMLLEIIAWSASFILFLLGHFRMLKNFRKHEYDN